MHGATLVVKILVVWLLRKKRKDRQGCSVAAAAGSPRR